MLESVHRALRLHQTFARQARWTVSDVSDTQAIAPSTARRPRVTRQARDFANHNPGSWTYVPGGALLSAGPAAPGSPVRASRDQRGRRAHRRDRSSDPTPGRTDPHRGHAGVPTRGARGGMNRSPGAPRLPAAREVLLPGLSDEQVAALSGADPRPHMTERSIGSLGHLRRGLALVRARGCTTTFDQDELGASAASATIAAPVGVAPAAVTGGAPSARLPADNIPAIAAAARRVSAQIPARLSGARWAQPPGAR